MSRKPVSQNKQLSMSAFLGLGSQSTQSSKETRKSDAFKSNNSSLLNNANFYFRCFGCKDG